MFITCSSFWFSYGFVIKFPIQKRTYLERSCDEDDLHQDHSPTNAARAVKATLDGLGHRVSSIDARLL